MSTIAKLGPGLWFSIHFLALRAVDQERKLHFAQYINQLLVSFPCEKCVKHFQQYIDQHPLINYWHTELGMFKWSVNFHNDVNARLGGPQVPYEEVLYTYQNPHAQQCSSCVGNNQLVDNNQHEQLVVDLPAVDAVDSVISSDAQAIPTTAVPSQLLNYLARHNHTTVSRLE